MRDLTDLRTTPPPPPVPVPGSGRPARGDLHSSAGKARWRRAGARLAASFPHGRLHLLRDCGHMIHLDAPAAITAAVHACSPEVPTHLHGEPGQAGAFAQR